MNRQPLSHDDPQRQTRHHDSPLHTHQRPAHTPALHPRYSIASPVVPLNHICTTAFLRLTPVACERARDNSLQVSSSSSLPSSTTKVTLEDVRREKERIQAELDRLEKHPNPDADDRCSACLYTGVATCAGLASYFAHLAWNDVAIQARHRPLLGIVSAGWVAAGAYRWSLG